MSVSRSTSTTFSSTRPVETRYRQLADYNLENREIIDATPDQVMAGMGTILVERANPMPASPIFTSKWYFEFCNGEYYPQVEKAMTGIYQHFLGYSLEVEIVKDGDNYASTRRQLKEFVPLKEIELMMLSSIFRNQQTLLTEDNGVIKYDGLPIRNVGKLAALTEFFGDPICTEEEVGIFKKENAYYAIKTKNQFALTVHDNDYAINFDELITDCNLNFSPTFMNVYGQEKEEMKKRIAETDFETIENILRSVITSNKLESERITLTKLIGNLRTRAQENPSNNDPFPSVDVALNNIDIDAINIEEIEADYAARLEEMNQLDPRDSGIDAIINKLRERHQDLQRECGLRYR